MQRRRFVKAGVATSAATLMAQAQSKKIGTFKIKLSSVYIDDQDKALKFYTEVLGFIKKRDIPLGGKARWVTVVSADEPNGTELLLEPTGDHPATQPFKKAIYDQGMPLTMFAVDDVQREYERLVKLGVAFRAKPTPPGAGPITATFDDTCGNFIRIFQAA
jgi:catechol 2,3-dioxygenase-like lactoylglutathione lyase family enzyme